jgi:hypothetical protein
LDPAAFVLINLRRGVGNIHRLLRVVEIARKEIPKQSNVEVAKICAVSDTTVVAMRLAIPRNLAEGPLDVSDRRATRKSTQWVLPFPTCGRRHDLTLDCSDLPRLLGASCLTLYLSEAEPEQPHLAHAARFQITTNIRV